MYWGDVVFVWYCCDVCMCIVHVQCMIVICVSDVFMCAAYVLRCVCVLLCMLW